MTATTPAAASTQHAHGAHRPGPGRPVPVSTYRLQIRPEFGFAEVARQVPYLAQLGVTHVYLSPILAPSPGSSHGYDVIDHSRLNPEAGGLTQFDAMVQTLHAHGLGAVVDVVPNHMTVPTPAYQNSELWSVLRDGPDSPYAHWFDVDWGEDGDQALLMPVLGDRIGTVLSNGELQLDSSGEEPVLRYFEHVFPVRAGTQNLSIAELVARQFYRLAYWKVADEELNYRRFFDVDTLAAVRVEDPSVFDATHRLLLDLRRDGKIDGFRIDHPDGLAGPRGYLRQLAEGSDGSWVVVEKILEGEERLPNDWPCAGTTGYDALLRVSGLLVDPGGSTPLMTTWAKFSAGDTDPSGEPLIDPDPLNVFRAAKREVAEGSLRAEVDRLVDLLAEITSADVRLRDHTRRGFSEVMTALLVAFDRYRAYVVPGEPASADAIAVVDHACELARHELPSDRHDTLDLVRDMVLGMEVGSAGKHTESNRAELIVRFQQTCGPVMAKGIEDTAFYRWYRLAALNEVGGDPIRFSIMPEEFHAFCVRQLRDWPTTMTTLTTHDTKRTEDTRAQMSVISQVPTKWAAAVAEWHQHSEPLRGRLLDGGTEYLVWQTLVGTWDLAAMRPISPDRLIGYLEKATKEAKLRTSWTDPHEQYGHEVSAFARGVLADAELVESIGAFVTRHVDLVAASVLAQKLITLTMPGVPDTYQGTEVVNRSLVDPDNRREVDYQRRAELLRQLDGGSRPEDLDATKLLVTSAALRLRRANPQWFVGPDASYTPLATTTSHLLAFARGTRADGPAAITLATRLPATLERLGGWADNTVALPPGPWRDLLTGREVAGGAAVIAGILADLPVALLVHSDEG